jgi:transcriptional repressor NrdR
MRCPKCSNHEDKVIDSRSVRNGAAIRRRRICNRCSFRFTTYEEVVRAKLKIIKRDGRHEEIDRDKLVSGLERACQKRPISSEQIETLIDGIIEELESEYEREVPSQMIGKKVMEKLEALDEVAFVRFASVYRRFKDVNQFMSAVEGLVTKERDQEKK